METSGMDGTVTVVAPAGRTNRLADGLDEYLVILKTVPLDEPT
jgi:hypothetical protein